MTFGELMEIIKPFFFGQVRHLAVGWGVWLATHHGLGGSTEDQFTGAVLVFAGIIWSALAKVDVVKIKSEIARLTAQLEQVAAPSGPAAPNSPPVPASPSTPDRATVVGASMHSRAIDQLLPQNLLIAAAVAFVLLFGGPAIAQTPVVTKAPAVPVVTKAAPAPVGTTAPGYPLQNGFYVGLGSFFESSSSTINTGNASTNLNSAGAALELVAGYQYKIGFSEISVNYTNLGGNANCGNAAGGTVTCSIAGPWGFGVGTAVWFNWTYILTAPTSAIAALFNGQTPFNLLPPGLTPSAMAPYAGIWADINSMQGNINGVGASTWQVSPEFRLGMVAYIANGGALDPHVGYEFADTSFAVGPGGAVKKGGTLRFGVDYKF